ncbi:glycosyltransferase [Rubricoccus marinus]|uniref:Glycosyltransferase subfamily 4-like N-terminal domain-containing protein n=1 Tax=Rubricoccus marinus TaxID=716817 RepID=A0A259TVJ9_9BACT|nr:glycosyltransferase [Rubricoccus marinus]OZC01726.1 hypothetical protein BSZ36_01235 [Rubricoccus marinus]
MSPEPSPQSPPLGVVHGYGFSGAGSNLWTRAVLRALAANGRNVHVVCQESNPARFDFVSEAWTLSASGEKTQSVAPRETGYPGRVTVHVPDLEVLPAYVRPSRPSSYVVYIPDLEDAPLAEYIARNARALERVAKENGVTGWVVNHTVMMAVAAARARAEGGAPFAILPHGSAIEYVVKKEQRSRDLAEEAARAASAVWALNGEMEGRIKEVFAGLDGIEAKMDRMPVGTDTSVFQLVAREDRPRAVEQIGQAAGSARGRTAQQEAGLRQRLEALAPGASDEAVHEALASGEYERSAPDAALEAKLGGIDWAEAKTVVFVGRLIAAKGMPALMMAFPRVAAAHPGARLIVAGTGGLREALEALAWALARGRADLVRQIVRLGGALEGAGGLDAEPFFAAQAFLDGLDEAGEADTYFATAQEALTDNSVVFTGFLDHAALGPLYGLADAGAFPSVVREASPLVVPESAAAGVLPVGPDIGGMGDSLRTLADGLPPEARALLLVRPEAEHRVGDLADRLSRALEHPRQYAAELRREAEARFDWRAIAERLATRLDALA